MSKNEKNNFSHGIDERIYDDVDLLNVLDIYDEPWPEFREDSVFESAVTEASEALQVERSMVILTALGAISTAAQGLFDIQQPTGNRVASSIMALVIAESGERKTTVEKSFFKHLRAYQAELIESYEKTVKKNLRRHHAWKIAKSALESSYKQVVKKQAIEPSEENLLLLEKTGKKLEECLQSEPVVNQAYKFIYEDTTPMALLQMMNKQSRNACLLSSEANGVFNGHAFGDLHLINTLWDAGDVIVDRVNTDSFVLKNARLTLMLMTQSSVIERFQSRRGEQARGMGFLARFILVKPNKRAGYRDFEVLQELEFVNKFNQRTQSLIKESIARERIGQEKDLIKFSSKAQALWKAYAQQIEADMQKDQLYEHHTDHASKLMDNITRIAGLVHYLEKGAEGEIDSATLRFAYEVGMRSSGHFLKHLAGTPHIVLIAEVLVNELIKMAKDGVQESLRMSPDKDVPSYLQTHEVALNDGRFVRIRKPLTVNFTKTDICQSGPNVFRNDKNFYLALDLLKRLGHVKEDPGSYRGKYFFSETMLSQISPDKLPKTVNGQVYHIRNLPQLSDQLYYSKARADSMRESGHSVVQAHDKEMLESYWLILKDDEA